jgi:hypothetical protein
MAQQHKGGEHRGRLIEHLSAPGEGHVDAVKPTGTDSDSDQTIMSNVWLLLASAAPSAEG